jgi:hypothetical protein
VSNRSEVKEGFFAGKAELSPRFVVHDHKQLVAMLTRHRCKQYSGSRPFKYSLLLAMGAAELVAIETGVNVGQGRLLAQQLTLSDFARNRHPKGAAEGC